MDDFLGAGPHRRLSATAAEIATWASQWSDGTRLSYVTTLIAEMKRRGVTTTGDVKGICRAAKLALMAHVPDKAVPITRDEVMEIVRTLPDDELATTLCLMWKTASRLTSITQLYASDVVTDGRIVRMTFRRGKTIISTGPYTLWAEIEVPRVHEWIRRRQSTKPGTLLTRTAEQLYKPIHEALGQQYGTRSLRRGALIAIAATGVEPKDLRLISRHTTDKGLYTYLDYGAASAYDRHVILSLTGEL